MSLIPPPLPANAIAVGGGGRRATKPIARATVGSLVAGRGCLVCDRKFAAYAAPFRRPRGRIRGQAARSAPPLSLQGGGRRDAWAKQTRAHYRSKWTFRGSGYRYRRRAVRAIERAGGRDVGDVRFTDVRRQNMDRDFFSSQEKKSSILGAVDTRTCPIVIQLGTTLK